MIRKFAAVGTLIMMYLSAGEAAAQSAEPRKTLDGRAYRLAFEDEFSGATLDTTRWDYRTDSKHWSTQLPDNVRVEEGILHLQLKKEDSQGMKYTGAGIITKDRFEYGYYETSMKVPTGAGWHTSFWLMGHDGQGGTGTDSTTIEIDILENDSKNLEEYGVNLHRWQGKHESSARTITTPPLDDDFHTIACTYTPDFIKFYFDSQEVRTIDLNELDFSRGDLNIWLTSIASHLGGTEAVDEKALPATAQYEYVRFYALEP